MREIRQKPNILVAQEIAFWGIKRKKRVKNYIFCFFLFSLYQDFIGPIINLVHGKFGLDERYRLPLPEIILKI